MSILARENPKGHYVSTSAVILDEPRRLLPLTRNLDPTASKARYLSPLRYPGAKSGLAPVIQDLLVAARRSMGATELLIEPFAGGASTSLRLVSSGIVERVLLADADPLVATFWQVAASDTNWLIDRMNDEPVTLERWEYWRNRMPSKANYKDLAVKCLFLNRTTFSGILHGRAGPIGGRTQAGEYKIDCRFNKAALADRLLFVGDLYRANRIVDVWCKDWRDTLHDVAEWYSELLPDHVVAYVDPPYLAKSEKLYGTSFDPAGGYSPSRKGIDYFEWGRGKEHYRLAEYLRRKSQYRWILSYDNNPMLLSDPGLYAAGRMHPSAEDRDLLGVKSWFIQKRLVDLNYSVSGRGRNSKAQELLITTLPNGAVPIDSRIRAI